MNCISVQFNIPVMLYMSCRKKRNIFPNKGFLKEICDFENQLVKSKHYDSIDGMNGDDSNSNESCYSKTFASSVTE